MSMIKIVKTFLACSLLLGSFYAHGDAQWDDLNEQMMMAYQYGDSSSAIEIAEQRRTFNHVGLASTLHQPYTAKPLSGGRIL